MIVWLIGNAGCAGNGGATVRLTPQDRAGSSHVLAQHFDEAYAVVRETGEMDVVLTAQPTARAVDALQQVMHLRVLWKPMRGTKTDQPSTTNATIDWTITSQRDALRYTGAGFVQAYRSRDHLQVRIRNASLRLASRRGDIGDPIGPAIATGTFYAKIDPTKVEQALAAQRADDARATASAN